MHDFKHIYDLNVQVSDASEKDDDVDYMFYYSAVRSGWFTCSTATVLFLYFKLL